MLKISFRIGIQVLFFMIIIFPGFIFANRPLTYFLPDITYDSRIPSPDVFLGYQVGDWHVSHALTHQYMQLLAETSDRATIYEYARTHEQKPLVHLVITSAANHANLESIRQQHVRLADPTVSASIDISDMPAVVFLGYGVHGNEPSSHNAALLVAWYLTAGLSQEVNDLLDHTVVIIDPSLNPDGQDRFASWVNRHRGTTLNPDPNNREFSDVWPGSRTNHYWFDLNRDWLPLVHPESQGRIKAFHHWKPNINTDHHEFGANSTFFFQPGIPSRSNPLTPPQTDDLTMDIARYHARAFDAIGQFYYTQEDFDDFYYGKGSSYPDVNGSIGILFEQAGTKGHLRETDHGVIHFAETIRNQVVVSLSTLEASRHMREKLLNHLRWFYRSAMEEAMKHPIAGYIFGDPDDQSRNRALKDLLKSHQVELYHIARPISLDGYVFKPGEAWVVPLRQPQHRLIRSMFEKSLNFNDSLFYDVSTWNLPLAFNVPYAEIKGAGQLDAAKGLALGEVISPAGEVTGGMSDYAYVFSWDDYYAAKALFYLQNHGLRTRVATQPFSVKIGDELVEFGYGSILLPVTNQTLDAIHIYNLVKEASIHAGIQIFRVESSFVAAGINLGSSGFAALQKPEVLLVVGQGVSSREAGEVWHLLDYRFNMPVTMVDVGNFNTLDLSRYNVIALVSGSYSVITDVGRQSLDRWVRAGGTIIAMGSANSWINQIEFGKMEFVSLPEIQDPAMLPYATRSQHMGARRIPGHITQAKIDITHPVGFGYKRELLPVYVSGSVIAKPLKSPFVNPLMYEKDGYLSGYIYAPYRGVFDQSSGIMVHSRGRGRIVSITDSLSFRGYWFGTNRMLMNTIFFGSIIRG